MLVTRFGGIVCRLVPHEPRATPTFLSFTPSPDQSLHTSTLIWRWRERVLWCLRSCLRLGAECFFSVTKSSAFSSYHSNLMSLPENQESSVTLRKLSFQPAVSAGSDTMSLWGESEWLEPLRFLGGLEDDSVSSLVKEWRDRVLWGLRSCAQQGTHLPYVLIILSRNRLVSSDKINKAQ